MSIISSQQFCKALQQKELNPDHIKTYLSYLKGKLTENCQVGVAGWPFCADSALEAPTVQLQWLLHTHTHTRRMFVRACVVYVNKRNLVNFVNAIRLLLAVFLVRCSLGLIVENSTLLFFSEFYSAFLVCSFCLESTVRR